MENLKRLRKEANLTQVEFAKKFNLSLRGYQDIENGINETNYKNLIRFANFFGCSVDYLLGHQAKNVLYLDSFTEDQKELIKLVQTLDERKVLKVIGYIERLNDTPIEEVLWKMNKREED